MLWVRRWRLSVDEPIIAPMSVSGVSCMTDDSRVLQPPMAPPIVASPAKRIEALTGDPNFMTSLARGLAVIHEFQERKRHLTIATLSPRTQITRAHVRRCHKHES